MHLRSMRLEDYADAYKLWQHVPGMNLDSLDNSFEGIARFLIRNPNTSIVAEEDGQLVGTLLGGTDGRKGFIYHTAVHPNYQGRHIGALMTDYVSRQFKADGIVKIGLFVVAGNHAAKQFWQHKGWSTRPDIIYLDRDL